MGNYNSHKVAIKDKVLLTVTEVAAYSGVGQNKLDEILSIPENSEKFLVMNGTRRLIKREAFTNFLLNQKSL